MNAVVMKGEKMNEETILKYYKEFGGLGHLSEKTSLEVLAILGQQNDELKELSDRLASLQDFTTFK